MRRGVLNAAIWRPCPLCTREASWQMYSTSSFFLKSGAPLATYYRARRPGSRPVSRPSGRRPPGGPRGKCPG
eukprot:6545542-Pyramimonas_sp.AAC.1